MVFGPWIEVYTWLKTMKPTFRFRWPNPNYITLHCMAPQYSIEWTIGQLLIVSIDAYLISLSILGSIVLYPIKNMAYIDALFFSAGAATQSGLNT